MHMKYLLITSMLLALGTTLKAQTFTLTAFDRADGFELDVTGTEDIRLLIDGLEAGDEFGIQLRSRPGQGRYDFGALPAGTTHYQAGTLGGTAAGTAVDLCLEALEDGPGTVYVTLQKGKPRRPAATKSSSPLAVTNSRNLDSLLNVVFRNESCFELFPDTIITGDQLRSNGQRVMQTGVFTGGTEVFGMESGIIISTGAVTDAVGPNSAFIPRTQGFAASNTHLDLDASIFVGPGATCPDPTVDNPFPVCYADVAVIQFEFIPTTDTISFNYIFFSEEYCFNLSAGFSDAFAFFLEGPNVEPNGRTNVARLPNGNRVSSETLNHVNTPALFRDNSALSFFNCTGQPNDPVTEQQVAYDGFSTKLQVKTAVTPCERHVLKLMVVDVGDQNNDSGILLEAGSFTAGLIADPLPSVSGTPGGITPIEACDTATITFSRLFSDSTDLAGPLAVRYNLITTGVGLNLADNGTDFDLPDGPFIIPAGDTAATLKIPILGDNEAEGVEAFIVKYDGTCNCDQSRDTFWIQDGSELQIDLTPDQTACAGDDLLLEASATGGVPGYDFAWPDGQTTTTVTYTPTGRDTLIFVSVTDSCGLAGIDSVLIMAPNVSATVAGDFSLCSSPTAAVPVSVVGNGPWVIDLRVNAGGVVTNTNYTITQDTTFDFTTSATVTVASVTDASGCGGATFGTATVTSAGISFTSDLQQPTCDDDNGSITLTVTGGNANHTFAWGGAAAGQTTPSLTGLEAGTYPISIARNSDPTCVQNEEFTLSAPSAPVIDSFAYVRPDCPGETIELSAVVSGGTAPYDFVWPDSLDTDSILTVTTATGMNAYPVLVTDACNVQTSGSVIIELPAFSAELSGRFSLCNGSPVTVPVTVSGPAGTYTLQLERTGNGVTDTVDRIVTLTTAPSTTDFTFTQAADLRLLSIINSAGCVGELTITSATVVDPRIDFTATVTDLGCIGAATGSIILTNPGTVPLDFMWADGPTTADRTGLSAGSYTLRIEDAADPACFRDTTFTIGEPEPLSLNIVSQEPTCPYTADVLAAIVTGGSAPYTFFWPDSSSTDSLLAITTVGGSRTYPVEVTDDCGNTVSAVYAHGYPNVRAEVSGNFSVCNAPFNADVPILLSGSSSYTFTVEENGMPRTLTASGDTVLNYTQGTVVQVISVTGADGCAGLAGGIANVTDAAFEVVSNVTDILCAGAATGAITFTVNGNPSAYTYAWDRPGLSGNSAANLTSGTYAVSATEIAGAGCVWDTTFTILEPASALTLVADSSRNETCRTRAFASVTYAGGTAAITYEWNNGTDGPVLGEVDAGTYEVTVTDDNGCELVQAFNLTDERTPIIAAIAATAAELDCNQTSLMLRAAQNTVLTTYRWENAAGTVLGNARELTVSSPGTYTVFVDDPATGCSAVDSFAVGLNGDLLELELPDSYLINCAVAMVDLTVAHPTFTGAVDYAWRFGGAVVGTSAVLPNVTEAGSYEVTVTRQDNGCASVATTEVVINQALPPVALSNSVITRNCSSPTVTIAATERGGFTYSWTTANGNISGNPGGAVTTVDRPGVYTVSVMDTLTFCTNTGSVTVLQDDATVAALAGPDQTLVCTGRGTILNGAFGEALAGTTGRWYAPGGTVISETRDAFTTVAGPHVFEAVHPASGCSAFDTVLVVNERPTAVAYTLQQPPCPEVGGRLFVTDVTGLNGPFSYSSPTGITEPFGFGLRGLPEGNNVLVVTDQLGCELRDTFQIFDFGEFTGEAPDVSIRLGEEATLGVETNRGGGALVQWTWTNLPDTLDCSQCPEPTVRPLESFIAAVAVRDTNGCTVNLRQNVFVEQQPLVYMPTAFSPANGDGVNDVYTVFGDQEFVAEVVTFGVFDRWGSQVFGNEAFPVNDPAAGWDGLIGGKSAQPGVYVYTVTARYYNGVEETVRGSFVLVR